MTRSAIYPGTFDPITYGHLDLIKRAGKVFDHIVIAVAESTPKKTLFSTEERVRLIKEALADVKHISIEVFGGLVVDFAHQKKINVLIRGLRMISDFEFELQMAMTNRRLSEEVETVFLMPSEGHSFLSSTLIKEAAMLGADLSSFVPDFVADCLSDKVKQGL